MLKKIVDQLDKTHPDHIAFTVVIPNQSSQSETICVTSNAIDIMRRLPGQESAVDVFCRQLVNAKEKRLHVEEDRLFRWKIPERISDEYPQKWLDEITHNQLRTACRKLNQIKHNELKFQNYPFVGRTTFGIDQMRSWIWSCLIYREVFKSLSSLRFQFVVFMINCLDRHMLWSQKRFRLESSTTWPFTNCSALWLNIEESQISQSHPRFIHDSHA